MVAASGNSAVDDRLAILTVTGAGQTPLLLSVRQPGTVQTAACPTVALSKKLDQIGGNAAKTIVSVIAPTTDCTWDASSDRDWIALTAASRRGTGQVEYAVQANPTEVERIGTITIGGEGIKIVQSPGGLAPLPSTDTGGGDGGGDGSGSGGGGGDGAGGGDSG